MDVKISEPRLLRPKGIGFLISPIFNISFLVSLIGLDSCTPEFMVKRSATTRLHKALWGNNWRRSGHVYRQPSLIESCWFAFARFRAKNE